MMMIMMIVGQMDRHVERDKKYGTKKISVSFLVARCQHYIDDDSMCLPMQAFGIDVQSWSEWACRAGIVTLYSASDYSVWLIIAVTVERYVAVCRPLHAVTVCRRSVRSQQNIGLLRETPSIS